MNTEKREDALTLGILQTIDKQSNVTQRHMADRLGVALGLANSYLKRCVKKGLVKIEQAPANRYLYYLTPRGFAEKGRLTAEYLTISFDFYRQASDSCCDVFQQCQNQGKELIVFAGISELAEIAMLRAREFNLKIIGFLDRNYSDDLYLSYPAWSIPAQLPEFDACILTDLKDPQKELAYLQGQVPQNKVYIPGILGITS